MDKKNILVITGSPRFGGNSDSMANAFIEGVKLNGHEVNVFNSVKNSTKGCIACTKCWSKGTACSFKDGFTILEPMLEKADVVVFASPLYWFGMTAHIKAVIDKLFSYLSPNRKRALKVKECALLMCGNDNSEDIFDGVLKTYKLTANYLGWKSVGEILVRGVNDKGDIEKTDALDLSKELGKSI